MKRKCRHIRLQYIGEQEAPNGKPLYLYNCLKCGSTISKKQKLTHEWQCRACFNIFQELPLECPNDKHRGFDKVEIE